MVCLSVLPLAFMEDSSLKKKSIGLRGFNFHNDLCVCVWLRALCFSLHMCLCSQFPLAWHGGCPYRQCRAKWAKRPLTLKLLP